MTAADPIPVSVVTGFLGSGKSTILAYLLRQPEFSRTAVVINEFGEIGLDHELIESSEDSVIALTTGCLCCKVRTDLAQTLQDLLRRRDEGRCTRFDRIVIETSGLADPAPILQTLMTDTDIAGRLVLGGVVTTVDTVVVTVHSNAKLSRKSRSQLQTPSCLQSLTLRELPRRRCSTALPGSTPERRRCAPLMAVPGRQVCSAPHSTM
jgi:G3E family GTPase